MEVYIFGGLITFIIIFIFFTLYPIQTNVSKLVQKEGPYNLNNIETKLYDDNSDFIKNNSVTFQGFFYLENKQKSPMYTPCSTTDPSKPNCDTGRYALCSCEESDCSKCDHKGYYPLINLNGVVIAEIMNVPDASRQGKALIQLKIRTQSSGRISDNSGNTYNPDMNSRDTGNTRDTLNSSDEISSNNLGKYQYIETFVLPNVPYYKWFMLTISREGRRFDIYYNDQLILSKYTSTNIYNDTVSNPTIKIGDRYLDGQAGLITLYPNILSASDIATTYSSMINTRGSPLFKLTTPTFVLGTNVPSLDRLNQINVPSLCPSGDCLVKPTNPPSKPFYEWSTEYA